VVLVVLMERLLELLGIFVVVRLLLVRARLDPRSVSLLEISYVHLIHFYRLELGRIWLADGDGAIFFEPLEVDAVIPFVEDSLISRRLLDRFLILH